MKRHDNRVGPVRWKSSETQKRSRIQFVPYLQINRFSTYCRLPHDNNNSNNSKWIKPIKPAAVYVIFFSGRPHDLDTTCEQWASRILTVVHNAQHTSYSPTRYTQSITCSAVRTQCNPKCDYLLEIPLRAVIVIIIVYGPRTKSRTLVHVHRWTVGVGSRVPL